MKRKNVVVTALIGVFFALASVGLVHAQAFKTTVQPGKTVDGSLYSVGREIDIEGTINGDVYCMGQNVYINATVHGDVLCAAQNLSVNGHIDGSVRATGLSITLNATVVGSASLAGQTVTMNSEASVGRDFSAAGSKAVIRGPIVRDASLASKTTQLQSTVGRNVVLSGTALALQGNAHIMGDLLYTSIYNISKASTAKVDGSTHHYAPPVNKQGHVAIFGILSAVAFPMLLLFAMALILLFPQTVHKISQYPSKKLGKTIIAGMATFFVFPVLLFVFVLSLVGVVAAIFTFLLWLLLVFLSGPIAAYYIGSMILARSKNALLIMLVGTLVLLILYLLPEVGIIAGLFAYIIGAGAIVRYAKEHFKKPVYKV